MFFRTLSECARCGAPTLGLIAPPPSNDELCSACYVEAWNRYSEVPRDPWYVRLAEWCADVGGWMVGEGLSPWARRRARGIGPGWKPSVTPPTDNPFLRQ